MKNLKFKLCLFTGVIGMMLITSMKSAETGKAPYKDSSLPVEARVRDLLSRMTLEEKIAQLTCIWENKKNFMTPDGKFSPDLAQKVMGNGVGQIARPSENRGAKSTAEFANEIQKFFVEKTRLGIPVIFHEEALHGHVAPDGTSFPQPIGLAGTWDPELTEQLFTMAAKEARLRGVHQAFTPVVDVARDPRWGRVEETYGEDPYLVSRMGLAAVRGFQGRDGVIDKEHVIATLKHFAAHGQPESGTNCAPANYSERVLREVFLFPFKVCVEEGKVKSIMASYNEIDGVPSHVNKWLLQDILRKEWKFTGVVVSDYYAVKELITKHRIAGGNNDAALKSFLAGVDIETPNPDCYPELKNLAEQKKLDIALIDEAVARVLTHKFELGLFENPYVDPVKAELFVGSEPNRQLALKAAHETITLLRNKGNLAPLDKSKVKTIAVIGPNANRVLLGGYSDKPKQFVTVYEGIKARAGKNVNVVYSEGCRITEAGNWHEDPVILSNPEEDKIRLKEAIGLAQKADVIILAIGGNELTSREAWSETHMGDRSDLNLLGMQNELVKQMLATGKPVYAFIFNGSPLTFNYVNENVPVIYECWYLGQETGFAVADVLFGAYNPGGKLPVTLPASVGQLPVYYNYKPTARRGYIFDSIRPMYPFGYGLSYTTFEINNLKADKNRIAKDENVRISVDVTNTGKVEGSEVVQLYIRDEISHVTRPLKELKDFKRVWLKPGEKRTVEFVITPDKLAYYGLNMEYAAEPGTFRIMVGNSSGDSDLKEVRVELF